MATTRAASTSAPSATPPAFGVGMVQPKDALAHFAGKKLLLPSFRWDEVDASEHAAGVAVAGITKLQVLQDVAQVLQKLIASGNDIPTAKAALRAALVKGGYWGDIDITNPVTGETRTARFNESRLSLILDTNARAAMAAGRWQRGIASGLPLVGYFSQGDELVRPLHREWDGTILPKEHPFWESHTPPCGWRCRCHFRFLTEKDIERLAALRGPKRPLKRGEPANAGQLVPFERKLPGGQSVEVLVPVGVDPGFGHSKAATASSRLAGISPRELADFVRLVTPEPNLSTATLPAMLRWGSAELPAPTPISLAQATLPAAANMTDQELVQWALDQVPQDADGIRMLRLPPGEPDDALAIELPLDEQWFMDKRGQLKVKKRERDEWLPLLIQTLLDPDQIRYGYARDAKGTNIRLRMVKQFVIEGAERSQVPVLGVFELGVQGWAGVTVHVLNEPTDPLQAFLGGTRVLWSRK